MGNVGRVLRRLGRRCGACCPSPVEALEPRSLLSAGPSVSSVEIVGNVHTITGVVVAFNEALNPATAQDPQAFLFGKPPPPGSNNAFNLGDLLPFLAKPHVRSVIAGKIQWSSVTYNDANHSVTLTPIAPFKAERFMRVLRVKGTGAHLVKDAAGNVLDGGADSVTRWSFHVGKLVHYTDNDGDAVTLTLRGRGKIYTFIRKSGDPDPTVFVDGVTPASRLTGAVRPRRGGDGAANIAELDGLGSISTNLFNNPKFRVQSVDP